jgi:hypothetical protein
VIFFLYLRLRALPNNLLPEWAAFDFPRYPTEKAGRRYIGKCGNIIARPAEPRPIGGRVVYGK